MSKEQFEQLMASSGVKPDTTLIIYGDKNNWFAAWVFWQAKIYGHKDVRLMNGGRKKLRGMLRRAGARVGDAMRRPRR